VYVADTYNNRVVKLTKTDWAQLWAQTVCGPTSLKRPRDVGVGSDGNVYVADTDNGRIAVLHPSTGACVRTFGTKGAGNGQFNSPRAVAANGAGGLWVADAGNSRVQLVSETGAFQAKTTGGFGEGPGQFRSAHCVFVDGESLNVCDTFNHRIQRFGRLPSGSGQILYTGVVGGTRPTPGGYNGAFDVAYGPLGELYTVDWFNHRIQKFDADGTFDRQWGGYSSKPGSLIFPRGVAVAADGTVVVTDSENNRIDLFTPAGVFVRSVKPASGPALFRPYQTAPAVDGSFWVADSGNNRVVHLGATGAVIGTFNDNGAMAAPRGIALGANGSVYVANATSSTVVRFSPDGTKLATLATVGSGPTQVKSPHGLRIAGERLFVADAGNDRVVVLGTGVQGDPPGPPGGQPIGTFGTTGNNAGQFDDPRGVAVDPTDGDIAVADFANNRISVWK
jgi:DNA-binding beta-propeller fold protein YncE